MSSLGLAVLVSRSYGDMSALNINEKGIYQVAADGIGTGEVIQRKETISSSEVPGRVVLQSVDDVIQQTMIVRVYGTTPAILHSRIGTLIKAFRQDSFTITASLGGQSWTWRCEAADRYYVGKSGGVWDEAELRAGRQPVTFSITRSPEVVNAYY